MNIHSYKKILAVLIAAGSITGWAACLRQATMDGTCYTGSVGDSCTATSPNCQNSQTGTVTGKGTRKVIEDVPPGAGAGKKDSRKNGLCTYPCKITMDCEGHTVTVDLKGSKFNIIPFGDTCHQ